MNLGELWKSFDEFSKENSPETQTGGTLEQYKHIKITNFLRDNEEQFSLLQEHIARIVSYYGGITSL